MNATRAAAVLHVSPQRVRQLCRAGKLRATVGKTPEGCDTWVIDPAAVRTMAAARGLPVEAWEEAVEGGTVAAAPVVSVDSVAEPEPVADADGSGGAGAPPGSAPVADPIEERWARACAQGAPAVAAEASMPAAGGGSPSIPPSVFVHMAEGILGARFKAYEFVVIVWAESMSRTINLDDLARYDSTICWAVPVGIGVAEGGRMWKEARGKTTGAPTHAA